MGDRHFLFALFSVSRMGLESRMEGQTATLASWGSGWGLLHLQQSLNKLGWVLEGKEGLAREGGSVQLVGRTQVIQAWGFPFSGE